MSDPPRIALENVEKRFWGEQTAAVTGVDLRVPAGEFCVLLGESGCGKTTTLKLVNRLLDPTAGTVRIDGEPAASLDPIELRRRIGYVFQGIGLFPHWTVAENVGVVPRLLGWDHTRIAERTSQLLERVRLGSELALRFPHELSGGQQQRVGVARALAAEPQILLADEPFGALDPITREALGGELREIHAELSLTTLLVTHDVVEALRLGDRIVVMRGGAVIEAGTPREVARSREPYVAELMRLPREQIAELERLLGESDR